jgi:GDP-4-dehydro-6-deoxy-D-mannose reductase
VDPSRLRPSDNPVIAGDRSRITAEAGWTPRIPIEQTLGDLLKYWRHETARSLTGRS